VGQWGTNHPLDPQYSSTPMQTPMGVQIHTFYLNSAISEGWINYISQHSSCQQRFGRARDGQGLVDWIGGCNRPAAVGPQRLSYVS